MAPRRQKDSKTAKQQLEDPWLNQIIE